MIKYQLKYSIFISYIIVFIILQSVYSVIIEVNPSYTSATCTLDTLQCPTLLSAVSIVNSDDEIHIAPGFYSGDENVEICSQGCSFTNVKIIGTGDVDFVTDEFFTFTDSNYGNNVVIDGTSLDEDTYNRAFYVKNNNFNLFSKITFQNFRVSSKFTTPVLDFDQGGAALYLSNNIDPVSFDTVQFIQNSAQIGASIAAVDSGGVVISSSNFINNLVSYGGGAIIVKSTNLTISDSFFTYNRALSTESTSGERDFSASGGAILQLGSELNSLIITNSNFTSNIAQHSGGAITTEPVGVTTRAYGYVYISGSTFTNNTANGEGNCFSTSTCNTRGGAIFVSSTNVTISDVLFEYNSVLTSSTTTFSQGGAIYTTNFLGNKLKDSITRIFNCNFTRNSALGNGGALYSEGQVFNIDSTIFYNNTVSSVSSLFTDQPSTGGAIWYSTSSTEVSNISNSFFNSNFAISGWGGAIFLTQKSQIDISNCEFIGNIALSSYTSSGQGGAIMLTSSSTINILSSSFYLNSALPVLYINPLTYSGSGGAIYAQSSAISVIDSFFDYNSALTGQFDTGSEGGALVLEDCYPANIINTRFVYNSASGFLGASAYASSGSGGSVYIKFSSAILTNCTFENNWVSAGGIQQSKGGAIAINFDYSSVSANDENGIIIQDSTFLNNTAFHQLCTSNMAGEGGALAIMGASNPPVQILRNNFTHNAASSVTASSRSTSSTSPSSGGAIFLVMGSNITIDSSNFENNAALVGIGDDISSITTIDGEYNIVNVYNSSFYSLTSDQISQFIIDATEKSSILCEDLNPYYLSLHKKVNSRNLMHSTPDHINQFFWLEPKFDESLNEASIHLLNKKYTLLISKQDYYNPILFVRSIISAVSKDIDSSPLMEKILEDLKLYLNHLLEEERKPIQIEDNFNAANRRLQSLDLNLPTSDTLYHLRPDIIVTGGTTYLSDCSFFGSFHIFSGDYEAYMSSKSAETDNDINYTQDFYSTLTITGDTQGSDMIFTVIRADLMIQVDDTTDSNDDLVDVNKFSINELNLFNSSLYFSQNIDVYGLSFIFESSFSGLDGATLQSMIEKNHHFRDRDSIDDIRRLSDETILSNSNVSFHQNIMVGYTLSTLVSRNSNKINNLIDFIIHFNSSTPQNSTYETNIIFDYCNVCIYGNLIIDSPFNNALIITNDTTTFDGLVSTDPENSNCRIYLKNNATLQIMEEGNVDIMTSTNIISDNKDALAIYNQGKISLKGITSDFVTNSRLISPELSDIATLGSLTSPLFVYGSFVQSSLGQIDLVLNQTSQNIPVLFLTTNENLGGTINLSFYTQNDVCPDLAIYDGYESNFNIINFETKYFNAPPLNFNPPNGLQFESTIISNKTEEVVPVPNNLRSNQLELLQKKTADINDSNFVESLKVTAISCEQIFNYYQDVATSDKSGSKYSCHICLMNTTCNYCGSDSGSFCSTGSCSNSPLAYTSAPYKEYANDCCENSCHNGNCVSKDDTYMVFECECTSWWYTGNSCNQLSVYAIVTILSGTFIILTIIICIYLFRRSAEQKQQVLEELREGILRHTETANNEYIQNMQQALILNDVFVKFDEIKLESKIGEGSFGVVHKATFRGAQVAVKQMRSMFVELTDKDIEEFRKEAYMMSRLRHPNIVLVMGISLVDQEPIPLPKSRCLANVEDMEDISPQSENKKKNQPPPKTVCIITEYLEQGSLADILYGPSKLPAEIWTYELILTCALQAARGMLYLHSHHPPICHRDLKSSNLVVDDHWVVKVTDFGMSRIVPERIQEQGLGDENMRDSEYSIRESSSFSQNDSLNSRPTLGSTSNSNTSNASNAVPLEMTSNLGTTAWCAPELLTASSKTRYSIKVDVYSFGMVLWELWEKKRPFEELTSRFDIMDAIRAGKRPPISDNCPPPFKSLIQRCWQTDPFRRPTFNYIVRYIKDELGRVKRNKGVGYQSAAHKAVMGVAGYIRQSFTSNNNNNDYQEWNDNSPNGGINTSTSPSIFRRSFLSNSNRNNNNEDYNKTIQLSEVSSVSSSISSQPELSHYEDSIRNNNNKSSEPVPMALPEGRQPLVKAVDRSLSHLSESPSINSPLHPNFQYNRPVQPIQSGHNSSNWRDKHVMRFRGWNQTNPDSGLPPSRTTPHPTPIPSTFIQNNSNVAFSPESNNYLNSVKEDVSINLPNTIEKQQDNEDKDSIFKFEN